MKNYTRRITITKAEPTSKIEIIKPEAKKRFFRRKNYKDTLGLVWSARDTYNENKMLHLDAFSAVCRGEYKNIFEAYDALNK